MIEMGIQAELLQEIIDGRKTVEGRLAKGKFLNVHQGDIISIREDIYKEGKIVASVENRLIVKIESVNRYHTFEEMLTHVGFQNAIPVASSIDDAMRQYRAYYSPADEEAHGIVAMTFRVLSLSEFLLETGRIAVIPTDTVYGVVARAHDPDAVANLYTLKHREAKPGTIVAASIDQLVELGVKRRYLTAVQQVWPGAVSVIIPCGPELAYIHQGVESLAFRIPDDSRLLSLLEKTGPLVTSSANHPGEPPATTIEEAKNYFGNDVAWYEDGGYISREPSTVIRVIDDAIEVVRQGAVKIDDAVS